MAWPQRRRAAAVVLVLVGCVACAAADLCSITIAKRSDWVGTPPPLSIAELQMTGYGGGLIPNNQFLFTMSSQWSPAYPVSSLYDDNPATFAATALNDPNPTVTVEFVCGLGNGPLPDSMFITIYNRQFSLTGTYNRCNKACVDRLSAYSVWTLDDKNNPFEQPLYMWSPEWLGPPPATNALLSMAAIPRIVHSPWSVFNCFTYAYPKDPRPADPFYFNANEMVYSIDVSGSGNPNVAVPLNYLAPSMTPAFKGYEVEKCFDSNAASSCASQASAAPGPRMQIAGPCGNALAMLDFSMNLQISNRPSSTPGCVGCAERMLNFQFTGRTGPLVSGGSSVPYDQSYTPTSVEASYSFDFSAPACFAGTSLVEVQGQAAPVALKDVRVGDRVRCLNTSPDMLQPTTPAWCEVNAWAHSITGETRQVKLSFSQGGKPGSLSLSTTHLVFVLASTAPAGTTAASVAGLGTFKEVYASDVKPGDRIAVQAGAAGFVAAEVTATEVVNADSGLFLPAISSPYLLVSGVVAPLWLGFPGVAVAPAAATNTPGLKNLLTHVAMSPVWMRHHAEQPAGTAGKDATWNAKGTQRIWPGSLEILTLARASTLTGYAIDVPALSAWFGGRLAEFRANPAAAVTLAEIKAAAAKFRVAL